jgi:hypothetical protein
MVPPPSFISNREEKIQISAMISLTNFAKIEVKTEENFRSI